MNRSTRRALAKATKNRPACGVPLPQKFSHRLSSQACVLFVPDLRSYVAEFSSSNLRFTELPELARIYTDDEVTGIAGRFREVTGCRVEVRPFLCQPSTEMQELLHALRAAPQADGHLG